MGQCSDERVECMPKSLCGISGAHVNPAVREEMIVSHPGSTFNITADFIEPVGF